MRLVRAALMPARQPRLQAEEAVREDSRAKSSGGAAAPPPAPPLRSLRRPPSRWRRLLRGASASAGCQPKPSVSASASDAPMPAATPTIRRARPSTSLPATHTAKRSSASPMTPPRPAGSGQAGGARQAGRKARGQHARRRPRPAAAAARGGAAGGWRAASPRPRSAAPARPTRCRTAASADRRRWRRGRPSRLRTGALVAWLSEGSCTDQVRERDASSIASTISATPDSSRSAAPQRLAQAVGETQTVETAVDGRHVRSSTQHRDQAMQRLGRGVPVLHHGDADIARARDWSRRPARARDSCRE